MNGPVAVFLSYRLGGGDGVSVEARKWQWAFRSLGFRTRRVAGALEDERNAGDTLLPFLRIDAPPATGSDLRALTTAVRDADVVIAENVCSLPLNPSASRAAVQALSATRTRVIFHHHDLPWERKELAEAPDLPPRLPGALHVALSDHARASLACRGIYAETIRNAFDPDPPAGDRFGTRRLFGFRDNEAVVVQPTRALPRKGVDVGLDFAAELAIALPDRPVRYWLTGPAEDGFGPRLDDLLARAPVPVTRGRTQRVHDAYAAADLVAMPSTWEGFGNPVVEAMLAERPVAAASYPVLDELLALGLEVLPIGDPLAAAAFLAEPDRELLRRNRQHARRELSLAQLPGRLAAAFHRAGWDRW